MMAFTKLLPSSAIIKSQQKQTRSLMFLASRNSVDRTQPQHHHCESTTSVYDQCLQEAMKLKTRIFMENRQRPTRFRLRVMKRVVVPPVHIPKKIARRKGGTDVVSGKRVPFTKAMWEKQKRIYRKRHSLSTIHE